MTADTNDTPELRQIRYEMDSAHMRGDRARVAELETLYNETLLRAQAISVEDMAQVIREHLAEVGEERYPSLMDVCDGREERAAAHVLTLMLSEDAEGRTITVALAAAEAERAASRYIKLSKERLEYDARVL